MAPAQVVNRGYNTSNIIATIACSRNPELLHDIEILGRDSARQVLLTVDIKTAIAWAQSLPCVIVIDQESLAAPAFSNLDLHLLHSAGIRVLLVLRDEDETQCKRLLRAGIAGFLNPDELQDQLAKAIDG